MAARPAIDDERDFVLEFLRHMRGAGCAYTAKTVGGRRRDAIAAILGEFSQ